MSELSFPERFERALTESYKEDNELANSVMAEITPDTISCIQSALLACASIGMTKNMDCFFIASRRILASKSPNIDEVSPGLYAFFDYHITYYGVVVTEYIIRNKRLLLDIAIRLEHVLETACSGHFTFTHTTHQEVDCTDNHSCEICSPRVRLIISGTRVT